MSRRLFAYCCDRIYKEKDGKFFEIFAKERKKKKTVDFWKKGLDKSGKIGYSNRWLARANRYLRPTVSTS